MCGQVSANEVPNGSTQATKETQEQCNTL
jgi:hypothetical protein